MSEAASGLELSGRDRARIEGDIRRRGPALRKFALGGAALFALLSSAGSIAPDTLDEPFVDRPGVVQEVETGILSGVEVRGEGLSAYLERMNERSPVLAAALRDISGEERRVMLMEGELKGVHNSAVHVSGDLATPVALATIDLDGIREKVERGLDGVPPPALAGERGGQPSRVDLDRMTRRNASHLSLDKRPLPATPLEVGELVDREVMGEMLSAILHSGGAGEGSLASAAASLRENEIRSELGLEPKRSMGSDSPLMALDAMRGDQEERAAAVASRTLRLGGAASSLRAPEANRGAVGDVGADTVFSALGLEGERRDAAALSPLRRDGSIEVYDDVLLEYIDYLREHSPSFATSYHRMARSGFPIKVKDAYQLEYGHPDHPVGWVDFEDAPDLQEDEEYRATAMTIVVDTYYIMDLIEYGLERKDIEPDEVEDIQREEIFRTVIHEFAHGYDVALDGGRFHRYCDHAHADTGWSCTLHRENVVGQEIGISPSLGDSLPEFAHLLENYRDHHAIEHTVVRGPVTDQRARSVSTGQ